MELVLIRHPPVDLPPGTCYGQLDVPPAPGWEPQLDTLKADLFRASDTVFSSPSRRCALPAEHWSQLPVHYAPELMELSFGEWEGKRWDDIPQHQLTPWMEAYWEKSPPGGESMADLNRRVSNWLDEVPHHSHCRLIVFTHAGVIRTLIGILKNHPPKDLFQIDVPHLQPFHLEV
ncbi:MAG: histidine phosphatase family protein [Verrucomicrobia bacterium]|nr:histidine phosphatase family protein [Verrucomicrobiota bacterium]MCH8526593.1 histidine phosphatase family protein [Kiritimatiellia bacterium]